MRDPDLVACTCPARNGGRGVDFGTHEVAVPVRLPPHMAAYGDAREAAGLMREITVDVCVLPAVLWLWKQGVVTHNSCCGHGRIPPSVCVADESVEWMALRYDRSEGVLPKANCFDLPMDEEFAEVMRDAATFMRQYDGVLRQLAK